MMLVLLVYFSLGNSSLCSIRHSNGLKNERLVSEFSHVLAGNETSQGPKVNKIVHIFGKRDRSSFCSSGLGIGLAY